jgi:hypothetical protein
MASSDSRRSRKVRTLFLSDIHRANVRTVEGALYCNTGDWVESCSARVENRNSDPQFLRWPLGAPALSTMKAAACGVPLAIPAGVRSALAVRRGSAIIAGQPRGAGDTN